MRDKNILIAIYSSPEYYPPTLNAIEQLSPLYDNLFVLFRNYDEEFDWKYPDNVHLIPSGKKIDVRLAEKTHLIRKVFFFLQFVLKLFSLIRRTKANTLLFYDFIPILAFRLVNPFIKRPSILWYHNHDVGDAAFLKKWSISWMAWKSEKWLFPKLSIFSLPSIERKVLFPMEKLGGRFFFLPNFPSSTIFSRYKDIPKEFSEIIKILYQGSIGPLHGIEEIIALLNNKINGNSLHLILKGFIGKEYKNELLNLAIMNGVSDRLIFIHPGSYSNVIKNSVTCHIGIGIHKKQDLMNKTLGTASNKIYEYAAAGMPVLLYDNPHFREYLEVFKWAFFTDCSNESLIVNLQRIVGDYRNLSIQAKRDFSDNLNFEKYFKPISTYLKSGD